MPKKVIDIENLSDSTENESESEPERLTKPIKTDKPKKQMTAIDWLINELERKDKGLINTPYNRIFDQAKKMEKQRIKEAHTHNRCINNQTYDCTIEAFYNAENYYNETFNK